VPLRLIRAANASTAPPAATGKVARRSCAFVNNMPDGAFDATERQFLGLLEAGVGSEEIEVRRYAVSGVPRGEKTAATIADQYSPVIEIRRNPPDLLIVTGSNPLEANIEDEPYWDELVELLSWARGNVRSMLLSCLSAHAALDYFDGLKRVHLESKCTGVFSQRVDTSHPLARGIEPEILLPHSRWSTVEQDDLVSAGFAIVIESPDIGWSVATRESEGSSMVLVQGHPEYDPSSLVREYRRDAGRYVRHERDDLPCLPLHCVAPEDWEQLEQLHRSIVDGRRDPVLVESYPFEEVGNRAPWTWRTMAQRLYANWLLPATEAPD